MVFGTVLQESITAVIALERLFAILFSVAYHLQGDRLTYIVSGVSIGISIGVAAGGFGALVPIDVSTACAQATALVPQYSNFIFFLLALFFVSIGLYIVLLVVSFVKRKKVHPMAGDSTTLEEQQTRKQAKIMRTVVVLVLVYAFTTGTALCVTLAFQHVTIWEMTYVILSQSNITFSCLNCLLNVFIFPLKFDELRTPMKAGFKRLLCGLVAVVPTAGLVHVQTIY